MRMHLRFWLAERAKERAFTLVEASERATDRARQHRRAGERLQARIP